MNLTKEAVAAIMAAVQGSTPNSPLEAFKNVRLVNSSGGFWACGGSGHLQITGRADRLSGGDFDVAVPADRLSKILGAAHADITLVVSEKVLTVRTGASRFSLPRYLLGEFPMMIDDTKKGMITVPAEAFRSALSRVFPRAADSDIGRPFMVSLIIEKTGDELAFAATDGFGLAWLKTTSAAADQSEFFAYIHANVCRKLKGLLGADDVTIALGNRMTLTTGDVTIDAAAVDFQRFSWRRVLRDTHASTATVTAAAASEVLSEALILAASDKAGAVGELDFGAHGIRVKSGAAGEGGYEGTIPCVTYPGQPMRVNYNIKALLEIFSTFPRDAEVELGYVDEKSAMVIESRAVPDYQAIYMPRRD